MSEKSEALVSFDALRKDLEAKDKEIERLQAKIDAAIEEACDTQPSWEWRCYAMAKALGANFDKPTSRYGIEGELQARVEELEAQLHSNQTSSMRAAKAAEKLQEKLDVAEACIAELEARVEELEGVVRDAHYEGYMAGVGDSEDYDHDPTVMEKEAWAEYEETDDE